MWQMWYRYMRMRFDRIAYSVCKISVLSVAEPNDEGTEIGVKKKNNFF